MSGTAPQLPREDRHPFASGIGEGFSYDEAFSRNRGLIDLAEQETLRNSCVAIPGMGGVGGIHLMTLTRLGIGSFRIADPDKFEVGNFNRQFGADMSTIGRDKAEVMAERAQAVNPELKLDLCCGPIDETNIKDFLSGVDVVVDGLDYFAFGARRLLFREAREAGLWVITAGPIGFSTAWLSFDPHGMSFDRYFDLSDDMDPVDMFIAFTMGVAPHGLHWPYFDLSQVSGQSQRGPSVVSACRLASGVAATEVVKVLLGRDGLRPAPYAAQFDAYRHRFRGKRIHGGNRHPLQRIKRHLLKRKMRQLGMA